MLTKSELKYFTSLKQKKYREEECKFLVEGSKLISAAIKAEYHCEIIFCTEKFGKSNSNILKQYSKQKTRVELIKNLELAKLADTSTPQEIVAVFNQKKNSKTAAYNNVIIALENINDPGNLGSILRNCDWFGFDSVLLTENCAEIFNPKVIRSSAGSVFNINAAEVTNFYTRLGELKEDGYKILCADLNGENIYRMKWNGKFVVAFANEANGPTEELIKISDSCITIPGKGKSESLNVANATAVILSEISKAQF
jgi:RNA methyltransferase, TrmH family